MPEIGDIFEAAVEWTMPDEVEAYNVFDFILSDGTATDAQIMSTIGSIMNTAYAFLQADIQNTVDIQEAKINKVIWSGTKWIVDRIVGIIYPVFTGGNLSDMLPHACSPCVTFTTTTPKVRGRKFIPSPGEDRQDESTLLAAFLAGLANFGSAVRTPTASGNGTLTYCILTSLGTSVLSNGVSVDSLISSQRRRKPGLGI